MTDSNPSPATVKKTQPTPERLARMEAALENRTRHITVVLEDIYQERNAAAVLRTCDFFGIQDVHVIENRNPFPKENDVARGAGQWLTLHRHTCAWGDSVDKDAWRPTSLRDHPQARANTLKCLRTLKTQGYRLAAATLRPEAMDLRQIPVDQPLALIVGTERSGLSEVAHNEADFLFSLPSLGFTQSLNLSVFTALCLYDLVNRLKSHTPDWQIDTTEKASIKKTWMEARVKSR